MEANWEISLIHGGSFLATTRASININEGRLTLKVWIKKVSFNILKLTSCLDKEWCQQNWSSEQKMAFKMKKSHG